jgi:hypothetical protein
MRIVWAAKELSHGRLIHRDDYFDGLILRKLCDGFLDHWGHAPGMFICQPYEADLSKVYEFAKSIGVQAYEVKESLYGEGSRTFVFCDSLSPCIFELAEEYVGESKIVRPLWPKSA